MQEPASNVTCIVDSELEGRMEYEPCLPYMDLMLEIFVPASG